MLSTAIIALTASCLAGSQAEARFTLNSCYFSNCVQQNAAGTWCYVPQSGSTRATTCTGSSADLGTVLNVHLQQGLSVAYYRGADNTLLGGADWPVPSNPGIVRLCLSGRAGDGTYQTNCMNIKEDNAIDGYPSCMVAVPQKFVSDGCYNPNMTVPGTSTGALPGSTGTSSSFSHIALTDSGGTRFFIMLHVLGLAVAVFMRF